MLIVSLPKLILSVEKYILNKFIFVTLLSLTLFCTFSANAQTSSFTYQSANGTLCSPVTINFTQTFTGNPIGYTWTFGDGQISNSFNPSIVYSNPGTYTVQLVTVFNEQAVESSQTIVINPSITASINADRNYICTPGNIMFTATTSGNISSYEWTFGDGTPNVTTTTASTNHSYAAFGNYTATVKATDVGGCIGLSSTNILVQKTPITGSVFPVKGCIPANVNFTANATLPTGGTITSYTYDYGDGSPASSNPAHTYTTVGSFNPSVTITTNEGCINTFNYEKISFGTPPTNHVAFASKPVYCGSEMAAFTSNATNANSWLWDFGDGTTQTVTDSTTSHKYATLGTKTITVIPYFNGCAGIRRSFTINIIGVIAGFGFSNTCVNKNTFNLNNTSQGNLSSILWTFGDGSPSTSTSSPVHTYPLSGAYSTTIKVSDNVTGCVDSLTAIIYTGTPSLSNPDSSLCRNNNTTFTIQSNYSNPQLSYKWSVIGLSDNINNLNPYSPVATIFGNFNNNRVVINNGGQYCNDTLLLNHNVLVRGPRLSFTTSSNICANTNYSILNTSSSFVPSDTIQFSAWNFGFTHPTDNNFQPKTVKFPSSGNFTISFVAKDNNGCTDSLKKQILVKPIPFLRIFPRNDTLCQGENITLIAYHSDSLTWAASPTLSCTTCDTTIATPTNTTLYYATVNNSFNCPFTDSTLIKVFSPFIATPLVNPIYLCFKDSVKIAVTPTDKKIFWSPSTNISSITRYNPVVSAPANTTYTAILTDSVGCFSDTASIDIIIKSLPQVNAGPDKILPYNAMFTLSPTYSSNVVSYSWTPSTSMSCTICPVPTGVALQSQQYTIKVTSDSACTAKDDITVFVECKFANLLMPSAFTPNKDGLNDIYYPLTRGIKSIKNFVVYNRFGQMIFEKRNFVPNERSFGWNGKFNGLEQAPGTYVYMLEAICDLGETIFKRDSFLLLR